MRLRFALSPILGKNKVIIRKFFKGVLGGQRGVAKRV
jgi:hypothetical protein